MKLLNLDPVTIGTTPGEEAYVGKYLGSDTELVSRRIAKGSISFILKL